ncbi:MAG: HAD-IIB family hydrolase [Candidatus Bathyarchaeia archaeon]
MNNKKIIIFSDVDGSLLNSRYEYAGILPILRQILSLKASVVLASSKTKAELAYYQKELQIFDPYIAENGSLIVIPKQYFKQEPNFSKQTATEGLIELGIPYRLIRERLSCVKNQTGASIVGFGDLTVEEVATDTSLPLNLAVLAKQREYSEPFKIENGDKAQVLQALWAAGLCTSMGGRYLTASGCVDKGEAVTVLKELYLKQFNDLFTVGVGDGENDLTMLDAVDKSFFIRNPTMIKHVWLEIQNIVESNTQ